METGNENQSSKLKIGSSPPPPPPLPPRPKILVFAKPTIKLVTTASITKQEISTYWKQKYKAEEDHLLAAIKAAARIRAHNLWKDYYYSLEESPTECEDKTENDKHAQASNQKDEKMEELRVGIKDWWTKSKYAYLNQPAMKSMDTPARRASSYKPQFQCYNTTPPPATTTTTFGIFEASLTIVANQVHLPIP